MSARNIFLILATLAALLVGGRAPDSFGKEDSAMAEIPEPAGDQRVATFAGGCFWCMEHPFDDLDGVIATTSGYTGGEEANPTYQEVAAGQTGHAEAVQVLFDPARVSYGQLLEVFWRQINPTQKNRQFCDVGPQYRTAIFYHDGEQERLARESKQRMESEGPFKGTIVTEIVPAGPFFAAEDYHQDYYRKNPVRYGFYRANCGRDEYLERVWGEEGD